MKYSNRSIPKILLRHYSVILIYLSYISIYILNRPTDFKIVFSFSSLMLFIVVILLQFIFSLLLSYINKITIKFIYLYFIILLFTFLNLTNFLVSATEYINSQITLYLRIRDVISLFMLFFLFIAYLFNKNFLFSIKAINSFLVFFIVINILYSAFTFSSPREIGDNFRSSKIEHINSKKTFNHNKNILFILLDEYSSPIEIEKFAKDTFQTSLFTKYLTSHGFTVLNNRTIKTSTVNSINVLFNQKSGLTFKNESTENALLELKNSSVIAHLEKNGYVFKNFSLYNIGYHDPFFHWKNPYYQNNYELLLNFSLYPLIISNLKEDSTSNSGYNKSLERESLYYLNKLQINQSNFVYIHFLIPHGPFYIKNEFVYKERSLNNYIDYWNFCNKKIIKYLESIDNLSSYKIIITGDHGFRSNRNINPFLTTSAFYNFKNFEIEEISTVQDIGKLLLSQ